MFKSDLILGKVLLTNINVSDRGQGTEVPEEADWCLRELDDVSPVSSRASTFGPCILNISPGILKNWPAEPALPKERNEKLVARSEGPQNDSDGCLGWGGQEGFQKQGSQPIN